MRLGRALLVLALAMSSLACGDDSDLVEPADPGLADGSEPGGDGEEVDEPVDGESSPADGSDLDPDTTTSLLPGEDDLIEDVPEPPAEEPPTTITPPAGYEPLCELGLAMWPLVQSFGEPDQDVAEVAEWYRALVEVMRGHLPALPDGPVADDTQLLIDGLQLIVEVLGDYHGSFGEVMALPKVEDRLALIIDDGNVYNEAGDRWDAALAENCGLTL